MPIKHAFSIFLCNLKLVVKIALMILIVLLIAFGVFIVILKPLYIDLRSVIETQSFLVAPGDLINHPFLTVEHLIQSYMTFFDQVGWEKTLTGVILLFVGLKFFLTLPLLPATKVLYIKMSTGFDIGITNAFISTGFQNLLLALCCTVVFSITDLGILAGLLALLPVLYRGLKLVALPIVFILYLVLQSARMAIICQWLPEICAGESKNIFKNLKNALMFSVKRFPKNFLCVLFINILLFGIVTSTFIFSFGVIPIVTIPMYFVLYCTLTLTLNFSYHKTKYYIDNGSTVYTPNRLF